MNQTQVLNAGFKPLPEPVVPAPVPSPVAPAACHEKPGTRGSLVRKVEQPSRVKLIGGAVAQKK